MHASDVNVGASETVQVVSYGLQTKHLSAIAMARDVGGGWAVHRARPRAQGGVGAVAGAVGEDGVDCAVWTVLAVSCLQPSEKRNKT